MADTSDSSNAEGALSTCMALVKYCPILPDEANKSTAQKSNPVSPMATSSPGYVQSCSLLMS